MAVRLAVVLLAVLVLGCGGNGGGGAEILPSSQWARGRSDNLNSGVGSATFTNSAGAFIAIALPAGNSVRSTPAIGVDGTVFVASTKGDIFAFTPDLEELWRYPDERFVPTRPGAISGSLAVDPLDVVYAGTDAGNVIAVDGGLELWRKNLGAGVRIVGSPVLIIDTVENSTQALIIGTSDGRVVALGGSDGQLRWQSQTGGAINGALAFDGVTIYAAGANGLLSTLTQRGTISFPAADLGPVAMPFAADPSFFDQVVVVTGLESSTAGATRLRGISTGGLNTLWDRDLPGRVHSSPTQYLHAVTRVAQDSEGNVSEDSIGVVDYVVVDESGSGWLVDPNVGSLGTRCIGGEDDQKACRTKDDCKPYAGTTESPTCEPLYQCVGGDNEGILCRSDMEDDCPNGACEPVTQCVGTTTPCSQDSDCSGGACSKALFNIPGARIAAAPVASGEGTLVVASAGLDGTGKLYLVDPPTQNAQLRTDCPDPPAVCVVAINPVSEGRTLGAVYASPSFNATGTMYLGDDNGTVWAILDQGGVES